MVKYYRNGKAVAEPDVPKRTIGNKPNWVRVGTKRGAICRECSTFHVETRFTSVWDAGMQQYVRIDICKKCDSRPRFQDTPETGLWESMYWQLGTADTENLIPNSGLPVEYIQHNLEYPCSSRVHMYEEMKYAGKYNAPK